MCVCESYSPICVAQMTTWMRSWASYPTTPTASDVAVREQTSTLTDCNDFVCVCKILSPLNNFKHKQACCLSFSLRVCDAEFISPGLILCRFVIVLHE